MPAGGVGLRSHQISAAAEEPEFTVSSLQIAILRHPVKLLRFFKDVKKKQKKPSTSREHRSN